MRMPALLMPILFLFVTVAAPRARPQSIFYVFNGKSLEMVSDNPGKYTRWQIWLYEAGARIPRFTASLRYSCWGLLEGNSAESVSKQLQDYQSFEEAYVKFFGADTWGRYTFLNPAGPFAVTGQALETEPAALQVSQLRWLGERVATLTGAARPSLENNENPGGISPVKEYFDQARDALQRVSKLNSQLSREHPQLRFVQSGIVQAKAVVAEAENNVPKITAVLPSVKLPASKAWMSHTEAAGSDGTIQVEITETGYGVLVGQAWTGGDGSMTGTTTLTTIPFNDIGKIDFEPARRNEENTWTVRVESGATPFPQTLDSPRRTTSRATFRAVHLATTESHLYLVFAEPSEARDAYAYFLYHKQLRR